MKKIVIHEGPTYWHVELCGKHEPTLGLIKPCGECNCTLKHTRIKNYEKS